MVDNGCPDHITIEQPFLLYKQQQWSLLTMCQVHLS